VLQFFFKKQRGEVKRERGERENENERGGRRRERGPKRFSLSLSPFLSFPYSLLLSLSFVLPQVFVRRFKFV
jgi:hypothetical protein